MNNCFLISFEGLDKCGKSTQIKMFQDYLYGLGYNVLVCGALNGTYIANKIKSVLLSKNSINMHPMTELLLYITARNQNHFEFICQDHPKNTIILLDRYIDSSVVYQGYLRGVSVNMVSILNAIATERTMPNITYYLDISEQTFNERMNLENNKDRLENDIENKYQILKDGYHYVMEMDKTGRFAIIEENTITNTHNQIIKIFKEVY